MAAGVVVVIGLVVTATLTFWVDRGADKAAADRRAQLADRALFVIRAQVDRYVAAGAGAFVATQQRLQPRFEPRLAEDVDEHGILYRVHPREGNQVALGFDVYANPDAGAAVSRSLAQDAPQSFVVTLPAAPRQQAAGPAALRS